MEYLFKHWQEVRKTVNARNIALLLDYDGTLTPIARTPDRALLHESTRTLLRQLSRARWCKLAVISGRSLAEIKKMVGLEGIVYAGNHGLEIEGPGIKFGRRIGRMTGAIIKRIGCQLRRKLSGIRGAFVEDKGLTLSVHYRLTPKSHIKHLRQTVDDIVQPFLASKKIRVSRGKKVLEIRPPIRWDKGKAVMWLLTRQSARNPFPIYVGDDVTDEDAFKVLRKRGATVRVGRRTRSHASYYLKNTTEVTELLERILKLQESVKPCPRR